MSALLMPLFSRLQRGGGVRDARGETGPPAQSRVRATYSSDVSVALERLRTAEIAGCPYQLYCIFWILDRMGEFGRCRGSAAAKRDP